MAQAAGAATGETIHTTANHTWLTTDRGWVLADDLHAGELVRTLDGQIATVAWVHTVPGQADYYNLTVADDHTYAVGDGQYVVHNSECWNKAEGIRQGGPKGPKTGAGGYGSNADGSASYAGTSHQPAPRETHYYQLLPEPPNGGGCFETWCADALGGQLTDTNRGQEIKMYYVQRGAKDPCTGCQNHLLQLAADNGADVVVYSNGGHEFRFTPSGEMFKNGYR